MLRRMEGPRPSGGWTQLLAAANMPEVIDYVRDYMKDHEKIKRGDEAWLPLLILAKYGDDSAIEQVLRIAENTELWPIQQRLLNDLIYIGQPEVAELAAILVQKNSVIDTTGYGRSMATKLQGNEQGARLLQRVLPDFPFPDKKYPYAYTEDEMTDLRSWLENHERPFRVPYQRVNRRANPEDFHGRSNSSGNVRRNGRAKSGLE